MDDVCKTTNGRQQTGTAVVKSIIWGERKREREKIVNGDHDDEEQRRQKELVMISNGGSCGGVGNGCKRTHPRMDNGIVFGVGQDNREGTEIDSTVNKSCFKLFGML